MSQPKELHVFDNEAADWSSPDYTRLHSSFDSEASPGIVRGEATPVTIYWPRALDRLRAYNPSAKLIVGLRHPSFRAFSHWRMSTARGLETLAFERAISCEGRARVRSSPAGVHRKFSYVERGLYASQITRMLTLFPPKQVHFFRTDELWRDPNGVLGHIHDFIGVGRSPAPGRAYVVPLRSPDLGPIPAAARRQLDQEFAVSNSQTAALSGFDLSDWSSPGYEEPMQPR